MPQFAFWLLLRTKKRNRLEIMTHKQILLLFMPLVCLKKTLYGSIVFHFDGNKHKNGSMCLQMAESGHPWLHMSPIQLLIKVLITMTHWLNYDQLASLLEIR